MPYPHETESSLRFPMPKSIDEAEERIGKCVEGMESIESQRAMRKRGETPVEQQDPGWDRRSMTAHALFKAERRFLKNWVKQQTGEPLVRLADECVRCHAQMPGDHTRIYTAGWTRRRGVVDGKMYDAFECPDCSAPASADVRAYLITTGQVPNGSEHGTRRRADRDPVARTHDVQPAIRRDHSRS